MSYNGSGTFQINTSGQPVVAGTVISSTAFNALTADLATGLSTAITKDGQTTTTARIPFAAGINSSSATDSTSSSTGSIITSGGVGIAKALNVGSATDSSSISTGSIVTAGGVGVAKNLYVGVNANIAGTLGVTGVATFSAAPIYSSLTASSAVATDASKALVSVTNTGTGNNVLATSPTLVTPILGTPQSGTLTNATGLPLTTGVTGVLPEANGGTGTTTGYYGFKNRIINGTLGIWQRGTSFSGTVYAADRWQCAFGTSVTTSQSSDVPSSAFQYSISLAGSNFPTLAQRIESRNSFDLVGQSVTISFWLKQTSGAGSNSIALQLYFPTASDNFASQTQIGSTVNISATSSWVQYTTTFTSLPSGVANGLALQIYSNAAGSATYLVTGVQLEKGSTATSFDYRPYGTELALCQRYFQKSYDQANALGTVTTAGEVRWQAASTAGESAPTIMLPVVMRATPTLTIYSPVTGASGNVRNFTTGADVAMTGSNTIGARGWSGGTTGFLATSVIGYHYSANIEL